MVVLFGCADPSPTVQTPTPDPEPVGVQDRIREALARLDDDPDPLHAELTPAVYELTEIGEPALAPTLPHLLEEDPLTRRRANQVVRRVMQRSLNLPVTSWNPDDRRRWLEFYRTFWDHEAEGNVDVCDATAEARAAYVERVENWLTLGNDAVDCNPAVQEDESIRLLIATINDDPDRLHWDHTPSVSKLAKKGRIVIPHMLKLMVEADEDTRLRAQAVLWGVISEMHGFVNGKGWTSRESEDEYRKIFATNGSFDYSAPLEARRETARRWKAWYDDLE